MLGDATHYLGNVRRLSKIKAKICLQRCRYSLRAALHEHKGLEFLLVMLGNSELPWLDDFDAKLKAQRCHLGV